MRATVRQQEERPTGAAAQPAVVGGSRPPASHPAELIDLIIRRAPELIAVGVTSLTVDGLAVHLSPPPPPAPNVKPEPIAKSHIDPLRDPSTYPGGKVPGFTRDEDKRG